MISNLDHVFVGMGLRARFRAFRDHEELTKWKFSALSKDLLHLLHDQTIEGPCLFVLLMDQWVFINFFGS